MPETTKSETLNYLRITALIVALIGACGSLALTFRVGRRNNSLVLIALFTIWVLSPFVALVLANIASQSWTELDRATLYLVILVVSVASLTAYGTVAFGPPRAKPAAMFLIVPLASWLVLAIAVSIAGLISHRLSRPHFRR